jgi:hypothetical protein
MSLETLLAVCYTMFITQIWYSRNGKEICSRTTNPNTSNKSLAMEINCCSFEGGTLTVFLHAAEKSA